MKHAEIFRDRHSGKLAFRVYEAGQSASLQEEVSEHSDLRKLRRALRRRLGRSVRLRGGVSRPAKGA